jgi:hypothetical protein
MLRAEHRLRRRRLRRFVRLVSDACAAGSSKGDAQALGILAPMVRVANTDEVQYG